MTVTGVSRPQFEELGDLVFRGWASRQCLLKICMKRL